MKEVLARLIENGESPPRRRRMCLFCPVIHGMRRGEAVVAGLLACYPLVT
jgi:hypothetical protein